MASIQRVVSALTGDVSYRAQVRVKGRASQSATFPNRREAQQWAQSIEAAIRENRYHPHLRGARTTFADLVRKYEASAAFKRIKESGQKSRKAHLRFFLDEWAGLTLAEIQPDRIAEARDKLAAGTFTRAKPREDDDGKVIQPKAYKRSGGAVNRYLATLSHVFTVAVKDLHLLDRNPVRDITKPKEARGRVRFLSDDERDALLKACEASTWKPLRALVLLAISTGARRGELVGLRWDDVDLKAGTAIVHETKNGEPRILPLVGKSLEALRELKLQNSARSDYVFPHPNGLDDREARELKREVGDEDADDPTYYHFDAHWYDAVERAGLENFRFHDLRHTTASYLAAQGASLLVIAEVLGHKTLAMVKRYSHLTASHKTSVMKKLAEAKGL
jgi:integrase